MSATLRHPDPELAARGHYAALPSGRLLTIRLPTGRSVAATEFARSWRTLKTLAPDALVRGWDHFPAPAARILAEIRTGLHDRINRHLPGYGEGRHWSPQWQAETARAAHEVNQPRRVVRWLPAHLRARLAHRLTVGEW